MGQVARSLIRELSERVSDFALSTPGPGGTTTLIDPDLRQYFPQPISQFNGWVYCPMDSPDALNRGVERRGQAWDPTASALQLYAPGFPQTITAGEYEIRMRFRRDRVLKALNSAIGQLGLTWYRKICDESVVTRVNNWIYYPANTINWSQIYRVEIQINTSPDQIGYPYADADYLNWRPRYWTDDQGNETWAIEFGIQPPPDRQLRIFAEGYYPQLVDDDDVLAISGKWEGGALEWIYDFAEFRLNDSLTNRIPTGEAEKIRQQAMDRLERQKNDILVNAPSHQPGRVVTPGHGDAMAFPSPEDWRFLGAFKSASFRLG